MLQRLPCIEKKLSSKFLPIIATIAYIFMITLNVLANALPINGQNTGQISDNYTNLFAPAGLTFSIWGIIYLLLLIHVLYLLGIFSPFVKTKPSNSIFFKLTSLFILSSVANGFWILAWHYNLFLLSVFIMIILLVSLIKINLLLKPIKLGNLENLLIKTPFAVYFGWITVATIANITVFLVSLNWRGSLFGLNLSEQFWTVLILIVGAVIGLSTTNFFKSKAYLSVLIWAYFGILIKHLSPVPEGFEKNFPAVILTVLIVEIIYIANLILLFVKKK